VFYLYYKRRFNQIKQHFNVERAFGLYDFNHKKEKLLKTNYSDDIFKGGAR